MKYIKKIISSVVVLLLFVIFSFLVPRDTLAQEFEQYCGGPCNVWHCGSDEWRDEDDGEACYESACEDWWYCFDWKEDVHGNDLEHTDENCKSTAWRNPCLWNKILPKACQYDADCCMTICGGHTACTDDETCEWVTGAGSNECTSDVVCEGDFVPPSPTPTPTPIGSISGRVRLDTDSLAGIVGDACTLGGAGDPQPGAGSYVTVDGSDYSVAGDGTYNTADLMDGVYPVVLSDLNPDFACTCPDNCNYGAIPANTEDVDFFVTDSREAWTQIENGSIHASGALSINIPSSALNPYLIIGEPGLMSYDTGWSLGRLGSDGISETSWLAQTIFSSTKTDYNYSYRILSEDPEGISDWWGGNGPDTGIYKSVSGVTGTTGGSWAIGSDQQTVLIHDGDFVINNNITIASGGFLALIVSGDLTIADSVTEVHGVYVADGIFSTCESASDVQFNGEGTFVGWSGVSLCRDFGTIENNNTPVEVFTYRPDFLTSVYNYLEKPIFSWQEVAP